MILHAGLIACRIGGGWGGVLIEGPSGAGKSDLALRALDDGFRLVADDRTVVWESGGRLYGRAPETLAGLLEVRGVGIVAQSALPFARIVLAAVCTPPERHPDPAARELCGLRVPLVEFAPLENSATAKLRRALEHLGGS
ncbi:MAG: HPr kinase/phosphorylase [Phenylobacterium sp.]